MELFPLSHNKASLRNLNHWFRSKTDIKKFSAFVGGNLLNVTIEVFSLSHNRTSSTNMNHIKVSIMFQIVHQT